MVSLDFDCRPFWQDIFRQILYIIVGTLSVVVNVGIILAIVRNKKLHRKNFILLAGLAIGHSFDGASYLAAGCSRLRLVATCREQLNVTRFYCMQAPSNSLVIIGESMSAWMILFLSLDRMISAGCTTRIVNEFKKRQCAFFVLAFVFVCSIVDCLAAWIVSYRSNDTMVQSMCMFAYAVPNWYYFLHKMHMIACGFVSVFVYVWVMCSLAYRRRTQVTADSVRTLQMKREWKVTKTLSFIVLMTFAFQIVPVTLYVSELKNSAFLIYSGSYVWTVYCANDAWDMLFYAWKMSDLRKAVKTMCFWPRKVAVVGGASAVPATVAGAPAQSS